MTRLLCSTPLRMFSPLFGNAVVRHESGSPERCPNCGSYSIGVGFNPDLPRHYVSECEQYG
jgi:hypothetical protein